MRSLAMTIHGRWNWWALGACLALASGCTGEVEGDVPHGAERDDGTEEPCPSHDEQLAEQAIRSRLVADLDPTEWRGWHAEGTARFATPTERAGELEDREPRSEESDRAQDAIAVLADGRQFRLTAEAVERFERPGAGPSELMEEDERAEDERGVPRSQIGADNRTRTSWANHTAYPNRVEGTILKSANSSSGFCSGALISPRVVLTAGHCIYDRSEKAWAWNTWFSPGHRGTSGSARFANGSPRRVVGLVSFHGFVTDDNFNHDIGFMILEDEKRTASLGWFGFGWWSSLTFTPISMLQHPAWDEDCKDAPYSDGLCRGFQYYGAGNIIKTCGNLLLHQIDTNTGSSGAPTWRTWEGGPWIVGPHVFSSWPLTPCDWGEFNKAVKLGKYKSGVACDLFDQFPSAFASRSCN